ncbi:D-alanyl-D-alanine carboxypeptidase [Heliobacterium chlorum]|uniref:D-alanyl-D-alanine carboxypeptidase n=1 Tax=Heliobacterium chlorum TaxID=2698 RepID=A0ABR7T0W0_HELCL|nr:D-alanyl-D-alanine carboxypeptidase family protein [Heliobacterium chlorum]MBC9784321.1 D-alanyl-D-alanine carboxypeptidase [Heliobacterium chlorum]
MNIMYLFKWKHKRRLRSIRLLGSMLMVLTILIPTPVNAASTALPEIRGESGYLLDIQSGQEIYSRNANEKLEPASTTKIMTALLAIEYGNLNDKVTITNTVTDSKLVYGTVINLTPGETLTLNDLLYATLLDSANDAAVAIAEYIGGSVPNFVDMMNARAQQIGATQTHFVNPTGLTDPQHTTTAHDLALIARVAYQNPIFDQYIKTKEHLITRTVQGQPTQMINENKLLWRDPHVDGMKVGFTSQALNCFVATSTVNGRSLVGVLLKSPVGTIWNDMSHLFEYGFTQTSNIVYKPSGASVGSIMVGSKSVNLNLAKPIYLTKTVDGQLPTVNLQVKPVTNKNDQVKENEEVSNVEVWSGNNLLSTIPLLSSEETVPPTTPLTTMDINDDGKYLYVKWFVVLLLVIMALRTYSNLQIIKRNKLRRNRKSIDRSETSMT